MRPMFISLSSQGSNAGRLHGRRRATSPDSTRTKCATVTMMLAERIIRNDWSVEDEHFFETNNMNVWQTLEFLSGVSLRRRYNYEGYSDTSNSMWTLTPSWRRDSFVEKNVSPNGDESSASQKSSNVNSSANQQNVDYSVATSNVLPTKSRRESATKRPSRVTSAGASKIDDIQLLSGPVIRPKTSIPKQKNIKKSFNRSSKTPTSRYGHRSNKKLRPKELDPEYALKPSDYSDLIKCTFNLPRISAALERLMGTNVVRLTDRNYMKELRERIEDDYRQNLQKRIRARELKEVERERILIIEGKTKVIPEELADDPIFVVDKKAEVEITKARAKLKTNREKNAERLKWQGIKWERERQLHEQEERQRVQQLRKQYAEERELEVQYTAEDATKGMNLLRIHDENWRPCEQSLKEFLQRERAKMKERSFRIPRSFSSDPKDLQNVIRAKKKSKETETKICKQIDSSHHKQEHHLLNSHTQKLKGAPTGTDDFKSQEIEYMGKSEADATITEETAVVVKTNLASDEVSDISSGESFDEGSTISMAKQRYASMLQKELEHDVAAGLLISKDQYDHLRYEDEKITQLRNARNIKELYQLAEEIIIGERIEFEDEVEEEEEG